MAKIEGQSIFRNDDVIGMISSWGNYSIWYLKSENSAEVESDIRSFENTTFISPDDAEYQEELNDFVDLLVERQEELKYIHHYWRFFPNAEKMFKEKTGK